MTGDRLSNTVGRQNQLAQDPSQRTGVSNSCPYFQFTPIDETTLLTTENVEQKNCQAVPQPFIPSLVHQSSCCLNPANYVRCPYFVDAMGEQKRQLDFQIRKRTISARLRDRLGRLLPFGRRARKKRRRVYFVV